MKGLVKLFSYLDIEAQVRRRSSEAPHGSFSVLEEPRPALEGLHRSDM
jgi:hypothetical protein